MRLKAMSAINDEMMKLLSQELRRVNAEIRDIRRQSTQPGVPSSSASSTDAVYALQKENARLKAEIQNVQTRWLRGSSESTRLKQEDVDGLRARLDDSELHEEATHYEERNNEARERLEEKIESARTKYREAKLSKSALQESVHETEAQLALVEHEHGEVLQQLAEGQARLIELKSKLPFDFSAFLKNPNPSSPSIPPTVELTTTALTLELPQAIIDLCCSKVYIGKTRDDVVWPKHKGEHDHTRFLLPKPSHHYHPAHNDTKGTWVINYDSTPLGKQTEFFHCQKGPQGPRWRYMGTYQHVGTCVHPAKVYGDILTPELLKRVSQQTMLFKEMIPPVVTRMVRHMYECGVLKIACSAWRRVGYNRELADALRAANMLSVTVTSYGAGSAVKRYRDEDLEVGPSEKRRKDE